MSQQILGRFIPAGQEVSRDQIAKIVTHLSKTSEKMGLTLPEFNNQYEEISFWASDQGLIMIDFMVE